MIKITLISGSRISELAQTVPDVPFLKSQWVATWYIKKWRSQQVMVLGRAQCCLWALSQAKEKSLTGLISWCI